jgi:hypothetical protein
MLLKEKVFGHGLIDIHILFTDLKAVDKTMLDSHKRPDFEPSSEVPEPGRAFDSHGHSISTLLAVAEAEFRRREQEKKDLFMKWIKEGTLSKNIALLISQVM